MRTTLAVLVAALTLCSPAFAWQGGTNILISNQTISITSEVAPVNGGTGVASLTDRAVIIGRGTADVEFASPGNAGGVLRSTGASTNPSFGQVDLADTDAITGLLPVANGGHGAAPGADDQVFMSSSTSAGAWKTLTDCDGATNAVTYDTATNAWGCNTISSGTTIPPPLCASTMGDITGGTTVHLSFAAAGDSSQGRAQTIATTNMSLDNLKCVSSVAPTSGQSYTATIADGACTGALTDSSGQIATVSGTGRTGAEAGAAEAVTSGECYALKLVASATAATGVVTCCVERIS